MPKFKDSSLTGTIICWCKSAGDPIAKGDLLARIETEDSFVDLESGSDGFLQKILVELNETAATGQAIAEISTDNDGTASKTNITKNTDKKVKSDMSDNSTASLNVTPILMPQVGNDMEEGTIVKWRVGQGDVIAVGDVIFDVETDKATIEIEADKAGRVSKIVAAEGETVAIKVPVAYIADNDADVDAYISANGGGGAAASTAEGSASASAELPAGAEPILMPQVGNDMEEGTIVKWRVAEGDTIAIGDIIFEVETDKATIEIEADKAGRLSKIIADAGETVAIKVPVAYLGDDDSAIAAYVAAAKSNEVAEKTPAPAPAQAASAPVAAPAPAPAVAAPVAPVVQAVAQGGRIKASPAARRIAADRGVNLAGVAGSGIGGRIVSTDVPVQAAVAAMSFGKPLPAAAPAVVGPVGEITRTKLAGMRKAIAANLSKSKQTIPHFYLTVSINAEAMMNYYRSRKSQFKCTVNDVVLMACGRALHEFPAFRSRLEGDEVVELPTANIGLAVGLENGLVVPVMQNVDRMSFQQIAGESKRLADAARGGKVEAMGRGSFTITNLGMFGVDQFGAIINPPESAILAVGAAKEAVIVEGGAMKPGRIMNATLSCDHRVVDGMAAAQFAARLKELLENPEVM